MHVIFPQVKFLFRYALFPIALISDLSGKQVTCLGLLLPLVQNWAKE